MARRRMRVYISGPISSGGVEQVPKNLNQGIKVWRELIKLKFAPFCPHMNDLGYIVTEPVPWEEALEIDEEWVAASEVMLRLPGESKGADREERYCRDNGIPIVYSIDELIKFRDSVNTTVSQFCVTDEELYKVA